MQLDSYLEIFTTMYGWAFANIIGEAITGTGLILVPFMLIVFNGWREAKESGMEGAGVFALIDRIGTQLTVAIFVFMVCFATLPWADLSSIDLSYQPRATAANPNPPVVSRNTGTNSTYDVTMANATNGSMSTAGSLSQVPPWWFTSMAIASGLNTSIKAGLSNAGSEILGLEEMARVASIDDPVLKHTIRRFYSECFKPAQSKFINLDQTTLSAAGAALIAPANTVYGPSDTGWMGSQLFRTESGFYDVMRAANPVTGFAVDFTRDIDYWDPTSAVPAPFPGYVNPDFGRPTCKEWWEDANTGVRQAMISNTTLWQSLYTRAVNVFGSADRAADEVARQAETKANPDFVDSDLQIGSATRGVAGTVAGGLGGMFSTLGVIFLSFMTFVTTTPFFNGLLMLQAVILMAMYMFLPLIVFLSGYDLKVMLYGAIGIFTVKFWAVLWTIVIWFATHLVTAMYPNGLYHLGDLLTGATNDYKAMLISILMMGMFIGFPFLWTGMMSRVGLQMGGALTKVVGGAETTANAVVKSSSNK